MIKVTESISIAEWELTETFSTSQGPGGQNVNKVSTGNLFNILFFDWGSPVAITNFVVLKNYYNMNIE